MKALRPSCNLAHEANEIRAFVCFNSDTQRHSRCLNRTEVVNSGTSLHVRSSAFLLFSCHLFSSFICWAILIRQSVCPTMRRDSAFPEMFGAGPLQIDNHHHHYHNHHHHHHHHHHHQQWIENQMADEFARACLGCLRQSTVMFRPFISVCKPSLVHRGGEAILFLRTPTE